MYKSFDPSSDSSSDSDECNEKEFLLEGKIKNDYFIILWECLLTVLYFHLLQMWKAGNSSETYNHGSFVASRH